MANSLVVTRKIINKYNSINQASKELISHVSADVNVTQNDDIRYCITHMDQESRLA